MHLASLGSICLGGDVWSGVVLRLSRKKGICTSQDGLTGTAGGAGPRHGAIFLETSTDQA